MTVTSITVNLYEKNEPLTFARQCSAVAMAMSVHARASSCVSWRSTCRTRLSCLGRQQPWPRTFVDSTLRSAGVTVASPASKPRVQVARTVLARERLHGETPFVTSVRSRKRRHCGRSSSVVGFRTCATSGGEIPSLNEVRRRKFTSARPRVVESARVSTP